MLGIIGHRLGFMALIPKTILIKRSKKLWNQISSHQRLSCSIKSSIWANILKIRTRNRDLQTFNINFNGFYGRTEYDRVKIQIIKFLIPIKTVPGTHSVPSNFMSPSKPTLKSQIEKRGSLEWMKTLQNLALEEFAIADSLRPMNLQGQRMLLDRPLPMF